jgi:hypothetical protein
MEKTPDQIRRATVPVKHNAVFNALLGLLVGAAVWFGGWALLHPKQAHSYKTYAKLARAIRPRKATAKPQPDRAESILRYALLRYGNENHQFDRELLRQGWYPKGSNPAKWVYAHGAIASTFEGQSPMQVIAWPLGLTLVTFLVALIWGCVEDARYKTALIVGVPLDGAIVANVDDYNKEVKGDGMRYSVKPWRDR